MIIYELLAQDFIIIFFCQPEFHVLFGATYHALSYVSITGYQNTLISEEVRQHELSPSFPRSAA